MEDLSTALKPLSVLELVAEREHPVTLAEVASVCSVPRPTLHRWLSALSAAGLLQRAPDGRRFELAPRATKLAFAILANQPGAAVRHGVLERFAKEVGEACNLTVLHGQHITYIDRVEAAWPLRVTFQKGSQVPVHCSASGKLFLAMMPPSRRDALLDAVKLERFTANTLCDRKALANELKQIRQQRFAVDREEYLTGLVCLAAPVFQKIGRSRSCVAALAIQAPVIRLDVPRMLERLSALQAAASALSATLE